MPERIVLIHVENAGDAHCSAGRVVRRERFEIEVSVILVIEEVWNVIDIFIFMRLLKSFSLSEGFQISTLEFA